MRYIDNEANFAPNNIVVDGMMVLNPTVRAGWIYAVYRNHAIRGRTLKTSHRE